MKIKFYKYQGTGNDFVMIDNRNLHFDKNKENVSFLCDRRFGIGADGLILLENHPELDFKMIYFNADGRESSMCGNGGRCLVQFAKHLKLIDTQTKFEAIDGIHEAFFKTNLVNLKMSDVTNFAWIGENLFLNTGSPHVVVFKNEKLEDINIIQEAHQIRYNQEFKSEGVNVNFVYEEPDAVMVRTYERGVENETLSCGTGVTAVALAIAIKNKEFGQIGKQLKTMGGLLEVVFNRNEEKIFNEIYLSGPAVKVFEGEIAL